MTKDIIVGFILSFIIAALTLVAQRSVDNSKSIAAIEVKYAFDHRLDNVEERLKVREDLEEHKHTD